jgi:putative endonuclease
MAHVYMLRCADGSYYVGSTRNLEHRLWQHQEGIGCDYTRGRRPVTLVFAQEYATVREAWQAERKLHGWSRAKREALIRGDYGALPDLSRSRQRRDEE